MCGDRKLGTHTETKYRNSRCACAPRLNNSNNNCEQSETITKSMATLSSYVCTYVRSGPRGINAQRANVWPAG